MSTFTVFVNRFVMQRVSTQPLTEMSTRNVLGVGGKGGAGPVRKAHKLSAISEQTVLIMWEPRSLTMLRASTACYRDSFIQRSFKKVSAAITRIQVSVIKANDFDLLLAVRID
jgi:hypothetical protein